MFKEKTTIFAHNFLQNNASKVDRV